MVKNYIDQKVAVKIFEIVAENGDRAYIAGAGAYAGLLAFLDWTTSGMNPDDYPRDFLKDTDIVFVDKYGIGVFEDYHKPIPVSLPFSMGSGGNIALGAMAAGASPDKAVKLASKYDPFTDSKVKTYKLKPKKSR